MGEPGRALGPPEVGPLASRQRLRYPSLAGEEHQVRPQLRGPDPSQVLAAALAVPREASRTG